MYNLKKKDPSTHVERSTNILDLIGLYLILLVQDYFFFIYFIKL